MTDLADALALLHRTLNSRRWTVRRDRTGGWRAHPWLVIHPDGRTRWWCRTHAEAQEIADREARR